MLCLGFEPKVAGWYEQADPLSYGGRLVPLGQAFNHLGT